MPSGWSQEGLQVTITNRAVKWGQDILYKSFFRRLSEVLGVEDWDLKLKEAEETDELMHLQIQATEIENMSALAALGFEITRSHTGEFKVSKDPVIDMKEMMGLQGGGLQDGRGKDGVAAPKEERQTMQGEPKNRRPSDIGGIAQGSPSSGKGTSMSKKNYPDGITPINFKVVKNILQSAVDHGWKKTKTVEQLRKSARMTVRQAREIVKSEFESVRRWEDGEEKE